MSVKKSKCPVCDGEGKYKLRFGKDLQWVKCERCEGTGRTAETVERKEHSPSSSIESLAGSREWRDNPETIKAVRAARKRIGKMSREEKHELLMRGFAIIDGKDPQKEKPANAEVSDGGPLAIESTETRTRRSLH